jgi:hypothetical protein
VWRKLHNEEINGLYFSPTKVRVTTSREIRWAGHVAHGGQQGCIQGFGGET